MFCKMDYASFKRSVKENAFIYTMAGIMLIGGLGSLYLTSEINCRDRTGMGVLEYFVLSDGKTESFKSETN